MPPNDHALGLPEELIVARNAMRHRCNVSLPYGGQAKYDLLIERNGEVLKIQVKTAKPHKPVRQHVQEIIDLDEYESWQVDFFAGVVDITDIQTDYNLSVRKTPHVFYKSFEEVGGQTARVNYRDPENMLDSNQARAKLPQAHEFPEKIEPELPERQLVNE